MKSHVSPIAHNTVASVVAMLIGSASALAGARGTVNSPKNLATDAAKSGSATVPTRETTEDQTLNPVIVTGTREVGVTAYKSSMPIQVISGAELRATGASMVFDALNVLVPSFSASAEGVDTDNIFRSARLRGMNPGEVLVLVNGKRRHNSAIMNAYQSPNAPSNPVDLDMIPTALVDHVEVLTDGASALYGSDAVAGVINIILKHSRSGGYVTSKAGITSRGDGFRWSTNAVKGFGFGEGGYIDISLNHTHQDFMDRSGIDVLSVGEKNIYGTSNGPVHDPYWGGPALDLSTVGFNLENPLTDHVQLYAFGTAGYRTGAYHDNNRRDSVAPAIFPDGFTPQQTLRETDNSITAGVKGEQAGWNWDLSATYGSDRTDLNVINTVNTGLLNLSLQPGGPPYPTDGTSAYLGHVYTSMRNFDARVSRSFDVGLRTPLDFSAGVAYRHENYAIGEGAPLSWEYGGTQAEAGFTPVDASAHSRSIQSAYVDLATHIVPKWRFEAAGRYEDYNQTGVGSTTTGMLSTRFAVTPRLAVRGTISSAFHAPTLAQEFYSVTAIQPTSVTFQAPPTSPGSEALGALPLRPETANDLDVGFVVEPVLGLHITADAYQIQLDHRVIDSALIGGPSALAAAVLNDPGFQSQAATGKAYFAFFNNGVNTRTRGVEFSAASNTDLSDRGFGVVRYLLSASFDRTEITRVEPVPAKTAAALAAAGEAISYLNPEVTTDITTSSPSSKIVLLVNWLFHKWNVNLIETHYGTTMETSRVSSSICSCANPIRIAPAFITDLDIGYNVSDSVKVDFGGTNVFDKMPDHIPFDAQASRQADLYPTYTPWGIAGADFYGRVSVEF